MRLAHERHSRRRHEMALEPLWLDVAVTALPCVVLIAFAWTMNSYQISGEGRAAGNSDPRADLGRRRVRAARSSCIGHVSGATCTRWAAIPMRPQLVGIPVRRVTLLLFALLGLLVAVAAVVSIARLNAGTNSLGTGMELYVIAAAVIGGTALSGGSGSILGSVLGALIMQSLDSGMLLLDVAIGRRMVIIGQVLIVAVVFDVLYRRRFGEK